MYKEILIVLNPMILCIASYMQKTQNKVNICFLYVYSWWLSGNS